MTTKGPKSPPPMTAEVIRTTVVGTIQFDDKGDRDPVMILAEIASREWRGGFDGDSDTLTLQAPWGATFTITMEPNA